MSQKVMKHRRESNVMSYAAQEPVDLAISDTQNIEKGSGVEFTF